MTVFIGTNLSWSDVFWPLNEQFFVNIPKRNFSKSLVSYKSAASVGIAEKQNLWLLRIAFIATLLIKSFWKFYWTKAVNVREKAKTQFCTRYSFHEKVSEDNADENDVDSTY